MSNVFKLRTGNGDPGHPLMVQACQLLADFVSCTANTVIVTKSIPFSLTHNLPLPTTIAGVTITTEIAGPSVTTIGQVTPAVPGNTPTPTLPPTPNDPAAAPTSTLNPVTSQTTASGDQTPASPTEPSTLSGTGSNGGTGASSSPQISSTPGLNPPSSPDSPSSTNSPNSPFDSSPPSAVASGYALSSSSPNSAPQSPSSMVPSSAQPGSGSTTPALSSAASRPKSIAGPIAGGVIGGLLLLAALFLLWFYRKRIMDRWRGAHRVAPSSEFLNVQNARDGGMGGGGGGAKAAGFTVQPREMSMYESGSGFASRAVSPYGAQTNGRSMEMFREEAVGAGVAGVGAGVFGSLAAEEGAADEPPPPFTKGNFNDPLVEKLNDAARQRQELYLAALAGGATANPSAYPRSAARKPVPSTSDSEYTSAGSSSSHGAQSSSAHTSLTSQHDLLAGSSYVDPFHESDDEGDMKSTSPMLNPRKIARMSMQVDANSDPRIRTKSQAGEIGWAV
ncbi:hypothetical protein BC835DRAFT_1418045 [Cytidiella melzeri]|nr:hypothetical protein BC835DRAFT_1418045 [Cytidiella melzeri]